ncbi:MAG TPA: N-acyl homoserine lactonase family protein [Gemmatimonadaceae bacterium]|nr:N-acyl homoserine lactonase family protein [Gemmatimonadaceae bacterium]
MLTTLVLALLGMSQPPRYHVDAIWFATEPNIPLHYLVLHADTTRVTDAADIFWVLRSQGMSKRVILFDAGYYRPEIMVKTKPARYERPSDAIRKLGVAPEAVTDVIVSHVHSDHVDGADLFPNAHIWIQKDEYEHYVDARGMPLSSTIDTVDAVMLAALKSQGRLTLIDGDDKEIIPGITVYTGGRHTYGSQYVGVATPAGTVVLASDNAVMYENIEHRIPIAGRFAPGDTIANLAALDRMRRIASDPTLIFPGHDPAIFSRYPKPGNGVATLDARR